MGPAQVLAQLVGKELHRRPLNESRIVEHLLHRRAEGRLQGRVLSGQVEELDGLQGPQK